MRTIAEATINRLPIEKNPFEGLPTYMESLRKNKKETKDDLKKKLKAKNELLSQGHPIRDAIGKIGTFPTVVALTLGGLQAANDKATDIVFPDKPPITVVSGPLNNNIAHGATFIFGGLGEKNGMKVAVGLETALAERDKTGEVDSVDLGNDLNIYKTAEAIVDTIETDNIDEVSGVGSSTGGITMTKAFRMAQEINMQKNRKPIKFKTLTYISSPFDQEDIKKQELFNTAVLSDEKLHVGDWGGVAAMFAGKIVSYKNVGKAWKKTEEGESTESYFRKLEVDKNVTPQGTGIDLSIIVPEKVELVNSKDDNTVDAAKSEADLRKALNIEKTLTMPGVSGKYGAVTSPMHAIKLDVVKGGSGHANIFKDAPILGNKWKLDTLTDAQINAPVTSPFNQIDYTQLLTNENPPRKVLSNPLSLTPIIVFPSVQMSNQFLSRAR